MTPLPKVPGPGTSSNTDHYQSPPGTYERLLKSWLELPATAVSDRAFRLGCYLATKPDGWAIRRAHIARELQVSQRWWVNPALAELRRLGYVGKKDSARNTAGQFTSPSGLDRTKIVAPPAKPQVNTVGTVSDPTGMTSGDTVKPQVTTVGTVYRPTVKRPNIEKTVTTAKTVKDQEKKPLPSEPMRTPAPGTEVAVRRGNDLASPRPNRDTHGLHHRLAAHCPELTPAEVEYIVGTLRDNPKITSATAVLMSRIKDGTIRDYVADLIVKYKRDQEAHAIFAADRARHEAAQAANTQAAQRVREHQLAHTYMCNYHGCTEQHDNCGTDQTTRLCDWHRAYQDNGHQPPEGWPKPPTDDQRRRQRENIAYQRETTERQASQTALATRVAERRRRLALCDHCHRTLTLHAGAFPDHQGTTAKRCPGSGVIPLAALRDKLTVA